jgi:hypothetical protein
MCVVCFRFRIDNTDHIIDVNKGNIPFEYDQVNIICPVYMPGTHEEDAEKYIIYNVSGALISCFRFQFSPNRIKSERLEFCFRAIQTKTFAKATVLLSVKHDLVTRLEGKQARKIVRFDVLTVVLVMMIYWAVTLCRLAVLQRIFSSEDGDSMFLRKVDIYLRVYTA